MKEKQLEMKKDISPQTSVKSRGSLDTILKSSGDINVWYYDIFLLDFFLYSVKGNFLSLLINFSLKSGLLAIKGATSACFQSPFPWNIIFCPFTLACGCFCLRGVPLEGNILLGFSFRFLSMVNILLIAPKLVKLFL